MKTMKLYPLIFVLVSVLKKGGSNELKEGPINPCEHNEQLVADKYSCTRYHLCRQVDGFKEFATDIAICSSDKVFDMVSSDCVDYETGFLQDPGGCTTFYGCHPTKETSEGFLRRHYTCPGDLRFNPDEKFCTFKTNVTDDLCNSRDPDQRILGDVNRVRFGDNENRIVVRGNNRRNNPSSIISRLTQGALKGNPATFVVNPPSKGGKPVHDSNLNRIAQVISGQLLSLQSRENEEMRKKTEKKESKKENNNEQT